MKNTVVNLVPVDEYIGILTVLDYLFYSKRDFPKVKLPIAKNEDRKILVDMACCSGMNEYRFISMNVSPAGEIKHKEYTYIKPTEEILTIADAILKENKDRVKVTSILSEQQLKQLLT